MNYFTVKQEDQSAPRKDLEILKCWQTKHNMDELKIGVPNPQPLNIIVKSEYDEVLAGLSGGTFWGAMHIDVMYVQESLRRSGLGAAILYEAENEARKRSCHIAYLSTISASAVAFYQRHGYEITGTIANFPTGHTSYELSKSLLNPLELEQKQCSLLQKLETLEDKFANLLVVPFQFASSARELSVLKSMLLQQMIAQAGPVNTEPVNIMIRDENGNLLAGLAGHTVWGALNIDLFFLSPRLRGQGIGSAMLKRAENVARQRGCHTVLANTHSKRAANFFFKHAYELQGTMLDVPKGHSCFWLARSLQCRSGQYKRIELAWMPTTRSTSASA